MNLLQFADVAYAAASPPGGGGSTALYTQLLFFAAIFAIFYFLLIRPQQKQKRDRETLLANLKKGDRVVTTGGLHGTITGIEEHKIVLRVADQVRLEFDRAAIGRIVEPHKHVQSQTDRAAEDLKSALERKGIALKRVAREGEATIAVELGSPQGWHDALTVASEFQRFARRDEDQAAGRFKLVMSEKETARLRDDAVRQGLETIRNRVDQFGVAEPTITRQGGDR